MDDTMSGLIVLMGGVLVYFLPSLIALQRDHRNCPRGLSAELLHRLDTLRLGWGTCLECSSLTLTLNLKRHT